MPTLTLNKSIEAKKLNPRNGTPLGEPEVTVPFGAVIDYVGRTRDTETFRYLTGLYGCPHDVLASALERGALKGLTENATAETPAMKAAVPEAPPAGLRFVALSAAPHAVSRAKVPGGWLVTITGAGAVFYPDPEHAWDGTSEP